MKSERRKNGSPIESYSERKITQVKELKTLLWGLELDEGLRFVSDFPGYDHGAFFFVTKRDDKTCVSIKERVFDKELKDFVPGPRGQWKYFETSEAAWQYISKYLKARFEVFYY